ncbi:MAG: DUF3037 domain-containing protein [Arcicella sp.]|nr:DUF3037 domain-containing protein [Arcicella sp.]
MQDKVLYEYAVIRVVPRVEREEFLNVGIILYCSKQGFLGTKIQVNQERFKAFPCTVETAELMEYFRIWERICKGGKDGGAIGLLPIASRFRWLTSTRSTIIQTSKVHPGFCIGASETLECLFQELVI